MIFMEQTPRVEPVYLIDTSAFNCDKQGAPCLVKRLFNGLDGLAEVGTTELDESIEYLSNLARLTENSKFVLLPEVVLERAEFIRVINEQRSFLRDKFEKNYLRRNVTSDRFKLQGEDFDFEKSSFSLQLDKLRTLADLSYSSLRALRKRRYKPKMDDVQKEVYDVGLSLARHHHSNVGSGLGSALETDRRLIASLFALGMRQPVALVSRDRGIGLSLLEVSEALRGISGLCAKDGGECLYPRNEIRIYNPDDSDDSLPFPQTFDSCVPVARASFYYRGMTRVLLRKHERGVNHSQGVCA